MHFDRSAAGVFVLTAALAFPAPVRAGDAAPEPDLIRGLYLEATGFATWLDAPDVEGLGVFFASFSTTPQRIDDEADVSNWGGGFDGRLGFALPGAKGWNLELGGSYFRVQRDASDIFRDDPGEFDIFVGALIDGTAVFPEVAIDQPVRQTFDGEVEIWDARLGLARDLSLTEHLRGKARIGIVAGVLEQDYHIQHQALRFPSSEIPPFDTGPFFTGGHRLDEQLDTHFFGPYLGLSLTGQLTSRLSISLDTDLSLLYNQTDLDAKQRFAAPLLELGGNPLCDPVDPTDCSLRANERDKDRHLGLRPRVRLGLDLDLGPFILGASAGVTYWSYAPQVVNPEFTPSGSGIGEAHISGDDMLSAEAGLKLTVPFGRPGANPPQLPSLIDGLHFESTGFATWISAPKIDGLAVLGFEFFLNDGVHFVDENAQVENFGGGFDARVGFDLPGVGAEGFSLELAGSYAKAEEDSNDAVRLGDEDTLVFLPITSFSFPFLGVIASGQPVRQRFDGEVEIWDVRLGVAYEAALGDALAGKLRAGLVGGAFEQDYEVTHEPTSYAVDGFFGIGGPFEFYRGYHRLQEQIDNYFAGGYLGASLTGDLTKRLSTTVEVDVALLFNRAELDAKQRSVALLTDGGFPGCISVGCYNSFDEGDKEGHFGVRPRVRVALDLDLGPFSLGADLGVTYWSYAPQVVNPTIADFDSAHIESSDMFAAEAGLRLTIPLGR